MKALRTFRTAHASDPGLERGINEDRVLADEERGILLVIDGLGGHAAGEMAAETALHVIDKRLILSETSDVEQLLTIAITEANNQIYELAQTNENWRGMACVLTLAVIQEDHVTVAHVGDTRLYLIWNGTLRKITSDHSPVGEKEDQGLLTEEEAMRHPRRNEVFRDVGSHPRQPDDPNFIEIKRLPFRSDAALLLCSDGLSDVLSSAEITAIIDQYSGDPDPIAHQLIEAANQAGGKDNVSAVFVAGPEFLGGRSSTLLDVRARHATTRPVTTDSRLSRTLIVSALSLLVGILLGMLFWAMLERLVPAPPAKNAAQPSPKHITVNPADPLDIVKAVNAASPGDVIEIPAGNYLGPVELKEGVSLLALAPRQVFLRSDASTSPDAGLALVARDIHQARVRGLSVTSDAAHPLRIGILLASSAVELDDTDVSGATDAGIQISGSSSATLLGNYIHNNAGPGVTILDTSAPRLIGNKIAENGKLVSLLSPGIEIASSSTPVLANNIVTQNGLATLGSLPPAVEAEIRSQNVMDAVSVRPLRNKPAPTPKPGT